VDSLDLEKLGFASLASQGRPPYHPADLLKLFIYGYMNRMRSSRRLELECSRNIELIWLLGNLKPDHNTISRFRKNNPKAIKRVFRATVSIAQNHNLIGATLIAGDSTKLRAQNSKKNNYNLKKVARHIEYIDKKLEEHNTALAKADNDKEKQDHKDQIDKHNNQRKRYENIEKQLNENTSTKNPQLSTSDPDSRHQITRGMITEVCYTAQTTVDEQHKVLVDYKVTNQNDKKAMGTMLRRAKSILKTNQFTALYDKGYHTGSEFKIAHLIGINTLVAIPAIGRKSQAPDPAYNVEHFKYDKETDSYKCPQGQHLKCNASWYKTRNYKFKQYKTKACKNCPVRALCTTSKANGKIVQRSEYKEFISLNKQRVAQQPDIYKKRQAIVEHPYGTIKRQWGFNHIITKKGIHSASADFGLIAIAYNLKRILNIIKQKGIQDFIIIKQPYKALLILLSTFLSLLKNKISVPTPFRKIHSHKLSNVYLN
jgi:transposase